MNFAKLIVTLLAVVFIAPSSWASIVFGPAFSYSTKKTTDNAGIFGTVDNKILVIDARLGYVYDSNGLYLGGIYHYEDSKYTASNVDVKGSGIAASIGYTNKRGFSAILSYYLMADRSQTSGGVESKVSQGKGMQFDVGWAPEISSGFGLGPQMTYRSIKYEKSKAGSAAETSNSYEETTLEPFIVAWFVF